MITYRDRLALALKAYRSLETVNRRCHGVRVNGQTEAALTTAAAELGLELPPIKGDAHA